MIELINNGEENGDVRSKLNQTISTLNTTSDEVNNLKLKINGLNRSISSNDTILNDDLLGNRELDVTNNTLITIPAGLTATGRLKINNLGNGQVSFEAENGVILNSIEGYNVINSQYGGATLRKIGNEIYLLQGDIGSFIREIHVFILAGQSNMVGRPSFDGGIPYPSTVQQYNQSNTFVPAVSPLDHVDEQPGDMGIALQFCLDYLTQNPNADIVLIPCADGGTGFASNNWNPGDSLYELMVSRVNSAFVDNPEMILKGFLWHQGESDSSLPARDLLFNAFTNMYEDALQRIDRLSPDIPLIFGGTSPENASRIAVNLVIESYKDVIPNSAYVDPTGLTTYDGTHFDSASIRVFGTRYLSAFNISDNNNVLPTIPIGFSGTSGNTINTLNWNNSFGEFILDRSSDDGSSFQEIYKGYGTSFTDTNLINNTTYQYRVSLDNGSSVSGFTSIISLTPTIDLNDISIINFDHDENPESLSTYSFNGLNVSDGQILVAATTRGGSTGGITELRVNNVIATRVSNEVPSTGQQRTSYFTLPNDVSNGSVNIEVDCGNNSSRCGVDVYTMNNADFANAVSSNKYNTESSGTLSLSVNITTKSLLIGTGVIVGAAPNTHSYTGLTERLEWRDYGDTFGSGCGDQVVSTLGNYEVVMDTEGNSGSNNMLSILVIPESI